MGQNGAVREGKGLVSIQDVPQSPAILEEVAVALQLQSRQRQRDGLKGGWRTVEVDEGVVTGYLCGADVRVYPDLEGRAPDWLRWGVGEGGLLGYLAALPGSTIVNLPSINEGGESDEAKRTTKVVRLYFAVHVRHLGLRASLSIR